MAQRTSKNAVMGRYQTRGEDFLHLIDDTGADVGGIDPTGAGWGNLQGGMIPPATKTLFVDGNRTDSYVANGSLLKPFTTIMGAVNQIIANGDNASSTYVVYVAPKTYAETIVLEHPSLVYVVFHGLGAAVVSGGLKSQANNSNLIQADFRSINFTGGTVALSGSGTFLSNGANFYDLYINVSSWTQSGVGGSQFFDAFFSSVAVTLTNIANFLFMGNRGPNTGTPISLVSSTLTVQRGSRSGATITVGAGSTYNLGPGSRQDGPVTVNGTFNNRLGAATGAITVNTGGTYTELAGGTHTGSLTLSGGVYTQTGTLGAGALQVGGIRISVGSGAPNGVVAGSLGDIYINTAGGSLTTFWVKESGIGTNTGWVGK